MKDLFVDKVGGRFGNSPSAEKGGARAWFGVKSYRFTVCGGVAIGFGFFCDGDAHDEVA